MGLEELLNTLKKNERKQIEDIWHAAEDEAETLRTQVAETISDITKTHADQIANACQKSMRAIFSETETKTRGKKLFAYQALEEALKNAATMQLPLLRQHNYEKAFASLVAELPERQWEKIVVNPADLELAAQFFAPEIIHADATISGGLLAETANGRIVVNNTLEKRLERKWPNILPGIIAEFEKQYEKSGTA